MRVGWWKETTVVYYVRITVTTLERSRKTLCKERRRSWRWGHEKVIGVSSMSDEACTYITRMSILFESIRGLCKKFLDQRKLQALSTKTSSKVQRFTYTQTQKSLRRDEQTILTNFKLLKTRTPWTLDAQHYNCYEDGNHQDRLQQLRWASRHEGCRAC